MPGIRYDSNFEGSCFVDLAEHVHKFVFVRAHLAAEIINSSRQSATPGALRTGDMQHTL